MAVDKAALHSVLQGRTPDADPEETREWLEALTAAVEHGGAERAQFLLGRLLELAPRLGLTTEAALTTPYRNTIPLEAQPPYPGDRSLEARLGAIIRWNALAMVVRANRAHPELGGHIASYASAADLFEVGFNHFFRADDGSGNGDLVFLQPHSAPGVYARAFLEGRLSEAHLDRYRRETGGDGLSSYPHPWLMPNFWQFPTGSMGLGPLQAIYQARFLRYLEHRGIRPAGDRHVWGIFGDGEMDEPESLAALGVAARERLDNVTFVINCNLQRLDGPVRGNGQIIQELEALFRGAGWNVVKVLWGSDWDALFARDREGRLLEHLHATTDGQFQTLAATDGRFNREHFFARDSHLHQLVAHMSDEEIDALHRGGHDPVKIHAAYHHALHHRGQPTVVLAKTKKGFGMGHWGQGRMTSHQQKKLDEEALLAFRDRFDVPLDDDDVRALRYHRPDENSAEMRYLHERRRVLRGYVPVRRSASRALAVPPLERYARFALAADGKEMSTTMAWARILSQLLRERELGPRIVPIVADEARTFGIANLFRQIGIYSPLGQLYEPEDAGSLLAYRESRDGQLLEEGITEAGALASWIAAGTAYSVSDEPMLPMYVYYSMFGFQRVGDLMWAAAEQRSRGFLIGATSGRTTLSGEGLQHQDGSSHVYMATLPNCRSYDPAYAYEVAVILDAGLHAMLEAGEDVFYYITVMNESHPQPSLPAHVRREDILAGLYRRDPEPATGDGPRVRLLGSGALLPEAEAAAALLREDWGVAAEVWSATSYSELERDARAARQARLVPGATSRGSHLARCLPGCDPVVAVSDYVRAWPGLIAPYLEAPFHVLGTDGFGRSDTRANLRRYFGVDRAHIVVTALDALAEQGQLPRKRLEEALRQYQSPH
ncbi:alpha-ketoglutarate dehydrogenase [Sediminicurvatus halobius]|uniref:Pyruvate dehydrogenase E1 component n=1 Tax=Sediminicurvatus halobius TaxID=2182432 RepID=A0A2U2N8L3_9GAMM|nr:alpha-ketoglutarate dehydrogenase [Spiribacter halobius]PWG65412.1 pyruvate dehydrogenase (acetyl-transferring), homodimeric type [Spiribacter halobius]UEX76431.1 alpha-ketoglutarate dehydrogenase [Spiribacter halobius]